MFTAALLCMLAGKDKYSSTAVYRMPRTLCVNTDNEYRLSYRRNNGAIIILLLGKLCAGLSESDVITCSSAVATAQTNQKAKVCAIYPELHKQQ